MDGGEFPQGRAFDDTILRNEEEIVVFWIIFARHDGDDFLILIEVEEVLGWDAFSGSTRIWNLVTA